MLLTLERYRSNNNATLGRLYINGVFECYTLEDEHRETKVMHETRIPKGSYQIKLRTFGSFHRRFKVKYPAVHKGMLWIQNVPNFSCILIHTGNTDKDTSGCILVGGKLDELNYKIAAGTSTAAYLNMYKKVSAALLKKEDVEIIILDKDKG